MQRSPLFLATIALLALATGLPACGSGGEVGGRLASASPSSPAAPPFEPAPPPAAWADEGCVNCHGTDGSGANGGPNIQCTGFERLDAHLRTAATSHAGGAYLALTDDELLDMVAFLQTADCLGDPADPPPSNGIPSTHTRSEDGVLHHPDYETDRATCTTCHGANLEGSSFAPSCASCHGGDGFDDDEEDED